jgi:predicted DNA-binding protein (UPF0251 family)/predicted Fe-Mo cluster-binding NifX family protein
MSRPKKKKLISAEPAYRCFGCRGRCEAPKIEMSLEEYETIALLDGAGLSQEETAFRMGVSRTTITALYASARAKIADFLIHGKRLSLAGGCYEIAKEDAPQGIDTYQKEGNKKMKIAVSYENEEVFQHFGQSPSFKFYEIKNKKVVATQVEATAGVGHRDLIPWLQERNVNVLICGGIGGMAIDLLKEAGIACYAGVMGEADEAVQQFLADQLVSVSTPTCDCHDGK